MDISSISKTKLILIVILGVVSLMCTTYLVIENNKRQPVAVTEESSRGSEATESAQQSLELEGYESLKELLPNIADTIPNQLLQYHYDHTKQLERTAAIQGDIEGNRESYTMHVIFLESSTTYRVTINVTDRELQDYSLNIREEN